LVTTLADEPKPRADTALTPKEQANSTFLSAGLLLVSPFGNLKNFFYGLRPARNALKTVAAKLDI
jgi:hypothetical protein